MALQYAELKEAIHVEQRQQRARCRRLSGSGCSSRTIRQLLLRRVDEVHRAWIGTRWGLGAPQTFRPHQGKINCGFFVGLVLRDVGFNLPVWKFNRQASRDAIRSLAPRGKIRYFSRMPMPRFLSEVRRMGDGLFVIGLDFHIGFLRLRPKNGKLRFVHASYLAPRKVIDEPAATALPIVRSRYRVVGKILQKNMLRWWLSGRRIHVIGNR